MRGKAGVLPRVFVGIRLLTFELEFMAIPIYASFLEALDSALEGEGSSAKRA